MRLGLIARAEHRGLGHLSMEFNRFMQPDAVLVIVPTHHLQVHREWYPGGALYVGIDGQRHVYDELAVRAWLRDVDVVYAAETLYDWRIAGWARQLGTKTVVHAMPEYWPGQQNVPRPDVVWAPTPWRLDLLPRNTAVIPVPVALDRFARTDIRTPAGPPRRWIHPGGAPAASDRNGTDVVCDALRHLRREHVVTVATQMTGRKAPWTGENVSVHMRGPVEHYWDLYAGQQMCVLPRRYAGLCLPAQEAMAAGCALVMSDTAPQHDWPIVGVPARQRGFVRAGIPLFNTDPRDLALVLDGLARDEDALARARAASLAYAETISWERWAPLYRAELEAIAA